MRTIQDGILIILAATILASCGDNNSIVDATENKAAQEQTTGKTESDKTYSRKGDCDSFIKSLDFSSLCFTEKVTPEYRVEISGERNCQFEFYADDKSGDIHMSITFSDYSKSIFAKDGDLEMAKTMFIETFKKKRTSKMFYTRSNAIKDLGDDAFIGYNDNRNEKTLCVRISNVSFTIQLNQIDTKKTCLLSDDELVKLGQIVVDGIKN